MNQALRFLQMLALGTWVGAIIYFAAVVTRDAFAVLPNRDDAGVLVGSTLGGLHGMGVIAALIYLGASLGLARSMRALVRPAALCVIAMLLLTLSSQRMVMPRMTVLRTEMVFVESTPPTDARRAEFDRLHSISVDLEVGVLLIGLVALFLTVRST
jgi:Domain of unknown function (DUF4149)